MKQTIYISLAWGSTAAREVFDSAFSKNNNLPYDLGLLIARKIADKCKLALLVAMCKLPLIPAEHIFALQHGVTLNFSRETVQVFFPGATHSADNTAVYFPKRLCGKKFLRGVIRLFG